MSDLNFTKSSARGIPRPDKNVQLLHSLIEVLVNIDDVLGRGATRTVYTLPSNPNVVLKVAPDNPAQNESEYRLYQHVRGTTIEKYFAEVIACSDDYRALIMQRTLPINDLSKIPPKLPRIVRDVKLQNLGMYQGNAVFHDYGINSLGDKFTTALKSYNWDNVTL